MPRRRHTSSTEKDNHHFVRLDVFIKKPMVGVLRARPDPSGTPQRRRLLREASGRKHHTCRPTPNVEGQVPAMISDDPRSGIRPANPTPPSRVPSRRPTRHPQSSRRRLQIGPLPAPPPRGASIPCSCCVDHPIRCVGPMARLAPNLGQIRPMLGDFDRFGPRVRLTLSRVHPDVCDVGPSRLNLDLCSMR